MKITTVISGAYSDRGCVRAENQDAVFCRSISDQPAAAPPQRSPLSLLGLGRTRKTQPPAASSRTVLLAAVCDGIGGLERGELSSGHVVGEMERWFDTLCGWISPAEAEAGVLFSHFRDAAEAWNASLAAFLAEHELHSGTTFSGFFAVGDAFCVLNVGDSRVYRYRPGEESGFRLQQLTEDQCVFREKDGRVRSYLQNYVGRAHPLEFDSREETLQPGDMLLACTDGFYHQLTETDADGMYASLVGGADPAAVLAAYAEQMIARGERDNLSAAAAVFSGNASAVGGTEVSAAERMEADAEITRL